MSSPKAYVKMHPFVSCMFFFILEETWVPGKNPLSAGRGMRIPTCMKWKNEFFRLNDIVNNQEQCFPHNIVALQLIIFGRVS